jgi:hypothetical protein
LQRTASCGRKDARQSEGEKTKKGGGKKKDEEMLGVEQLQLFEIGWTEVQEAYYRSLGSRRTGLRWTVAIINKLWDIAWDLWEQRNSILHDKEYQEQLQNLPGINNEVWYQYQKGGATLPSRLRFLFEGPLEELLETSMKYKQKGLRSVMVARRAADKRGAAQDQSLQGSRQLLRAWLDSAREDG